MSLFNFFELPKQASEHLYLCPTFYEALEVWTSNTKASTESANQG